MLMGSEELMKFNIIYTCRLTILAFSVFSCVVAQGKEPTPEIQAFAEQITDVTWWSRGTNQVKGVRFDGDELCPVNAEGRVMKPYDTYFVEDKILFVEYADGSSGWYIFDDHLKYFTSLKVKTVRHFTLPEGAVAKPINSFPKDVEGVIFESPEVEDGTPRVKFRWEKGQFQMSVLKNKNWVTQSSTPFVAHRRVFELSSEAAGVVWFVFSGDGSEVYLLSVENIFGGHREEVQVFSKMTPQESGLPEQLNDLANHMLDLIKDGVNEPVHTLQRQFERKLADKPALLERLKRKVTEW